LKDSELVQGLRRGDPAAMQRLCDCYLPSLWRFVYMRVHRDQHLAEDITHETILGMLTTIQSEIHPDTKILNVAGWLRTVAGRRIADHFRAVSRVQHLLPPAAADCAGMPADDPARQQEAKETRAEVREAMDALPEQYRLVLEWKYLDKLSVREIAARWDTTEKAAESILFRARREFRDIMNRRQPVEPARNGTPMRSTARMPDDPVKESTSHKLA
jgi:RNA polymerase sigma factor (sigma-70 family)